MSEKATIHVVDDDDGERRAIGLLFEGHGYRVRCFPGAEAFLAADPAAPGCLITDMMMNPMNGLSLLQAIGPMRPDLPVIVITAHGDVESAVTAMKHGAFDFIEKPFKEDALLARAAEATRLSTELHRESLARDEARAALASLTPRERDVFFRLVGGRTNKVIAHDLGISERTVETHRANIMRKMKASGLADLIDLARRGA